MKKINRKEIFSQPREEGCFSFNLDLPNARVFEGYGRYEVLWCDRTQFFHLTRLYKTFYVLRELVTPYEQRTIIRKNLRSGMRETRGAVKLQAFVLGSDLTLYRESNLGDSLYYRFADRANPLGNRRFREFWLSVPKVYEGQFYSPKGELVFKESLWQEHEKFYHLFLLDGEQYYEEISEEAYLSAKSEWEEKCLVPKFPSKRNIFFAFKAKENEQFRVAIPLENIDVR